jgi:hypothetical protein
LAVVYLQNFSLYLYKNHRPNKTVLLYLPWVTSSIFFVFVEFTLLSCLFYSLFNPELALLGFHQDIDGEWVIDRAEHVLDGSGYRTVLSASISK